MRKKVRSIQHDYLDIRLSRAHDCLAYATPTGVVVYLNDMIDHSELVETFIHEDIHYAIFQTGCRANEQKQHKVMQLMETQWF